MLTGAVMLVAGVGVAVLWMAVITIGIALVAIKPTASARGNITSETPVLASLVGA